MSRAVKLPCSICGEAEATVKLPDSTPVCPVCYAQCPDCGESPCKCSKESAEPYDPYQRPYFGPRFPYGC